MGRRLDPVIGYANECSFVKAVFSLFVAWRYGTKGRVGV